MTDAPNELTERLLSALKQDEFVLYTQRIVPLAPQADDPGFMEIFVRFSEEDTRLLPPVRSSPCWKSSACCLTWTAGW